MSSRSETSGGFTETHFRSVVEGSLQGIIIQQDDRIVYANPAMARLFGYASGEDMIGLDPFVDLILDEDLDVFRARTAAVYRGASVTPHPGWRARHRTGKEVWMVSTAHVSEWQGRPAVTSFYFDITERRQAELALQDSEARYRSALIAGRLGAWETDLVAGTRTWTSEGLALFGLHLPSGRGLVGGSDDEYVLAMHPEDRHLAAHYRQLADQMESFAAEYRIIRPDGAVVWLAGRGQVVSRTADGKARRLVSIMADVTERKVIELQNRILVEEIGHRSKNLLGVIQAISRQTAASARTMAEFQAALDNRLQGLAASQDVLLREQWRGAPIGSIVRAHISAFADLARVDIAGPDVLLTAEATRAVGMAMHELATNAVKHGALSVSTGRVSVHWTRESDSVIRLHWIETGGPGVTPPRRTGFGHVVLTQMIAGTLGGSTELSFPAEGVRWTARLPADCIGASGV